jgi:hypothetical protein
MVPFGIAIPFNAGWEIRLQDWLSREADCSYDTASCGNDIRRQAQKHRLTPSTPSSACYPIQYQFPSMTLGHRMATGSAG